MENIYTKPARTGMSGADILILSNGPGEVATWVRPVVRSLRERLDRDSARITVVLSPCPNASGTEAAIARSYPEVDRVQGAEHFWAFLLWGKTNENWDWRSVGVVLFLGGDQFFAVAIGRRYGYRTVVYAEWEALWHQWIDRFGVMKPEIIDRVKPKYAHKFTVVGDLMAEAGHRSSVIGDRSSVMGNNQIDCTARLVANANYFSPITNHQSPITNDQIELIGLLPGSKPGKLAQGVPLGLAIASRIHAARPQTRFVIFVAPTLNIQTLAKFADPKLNSVIHLVDGEGAELIEVDSEKGKQFFLKTSSGMQVELWTKFPAYDLLSQCRLCLTTVGANTAELAALAVPMIVLLPTQQLEAMRAWNGVPGMLANLPGVGTPLAKLINWLALRQLPGRYLAWPNIWAQSSIVPELLGKLQPQDVAELALDFLDRPEKLEEMRERLRSVRGQPGASQKLAEIVCQELIVRSVIGHRS